MQINTTQEASTLNISVDGEVNSSNAEQLVAALSVSDEIMRINLDLAQMAYISSAGLRALLMAEKSMKGVGGKMVISNVADDVMEIFNITGFANILTIE